jgi:hypothetical protein
MRFQYIARVAKDGRQHYMLASVKRLKFSFHQMSLIYFLHMCRHCQSFTISLNELSLKCIKENIYIMTFSVSYIIKLVAFGLSIQISPVQENCRNRVYICQLLVEANIDLIAYHQMP